MHIVIFITASGKKEAAGIAKALLVEKSVACVSIVDKLESFFRWKGRISRAKECLLIVKSTRAKLAKITETVRSLHSYEVPEIIALPIVGGNKNYLDWIDDSIR